MKRLLLIALALLLLASTVYAQNCICTWRDRQTGECKMWTCF